MNKILCLLGLLAMCEGTLGFASNMPEEIELKLNGRTERFKPIASAKEKFAYANARDPRDNAVRVRGISFKPKQLMGEEEVRESIGVGNIRSIKAGRRGWYSVQLSEDVDPIKLTSILQKQNLGIVEPDFESAISYGDKSPMEKNT